MKILSRFIQGAPLFLPLLAVIGAILGGWWYLLALVAVLAAFVHRRWRVGICSLLCALAAGVHTDLVEQRAAEFRATVETQEMVELRGTVERSLNYGFVLSTGWNGVRVVLRGRTLYTPGDKVLVRAVLQKERPAGVLGLFDAEGWMRGQGYAASLDLIESRKLGKPFSLRTLQYWGLRVRDELATRLMPPGTGSDPARQVLCSLVLGDKSGAAPETMEAFRTGGCLHAFAVSGLHVGLVSGILWMLLRRLRVRPVVIRPLLLLVVGAYVLMTGCAVPAFRAYLMLAVLLLGFMLRRRVNLRNTWSFAALLILLIDPSQLRNAGFLLSFGVYATIFLAVTVCKQETPWFGPDAYIPVTLRTPWEMRVWRFEMGVRGTVIVALSAWLVSLPVTITFFHSVNTSSFLTNIAITPLLPVVMFCGLLHLCLGTLPWLGIVTGWAAQKSAMLLLAVVSWFGELPWAYLPAQQPTPLHSIMMQGISYGSSFTILGNHGLLIDCGTPDTARSRTVPTLFHSGYTPAALLVTSPRASSGGGAEEVRRMWLGIPVIRAHELPAEGISFETQAGRFVIYPPRAETIQKPSDYHPVVLWESAAGRILYIGNADYITYASLPELQPDTVILGKYVKPEDVPAVRVLQLPVSAENRRFILTPEVAEGTP